MNSFRWLALGIATLGLFVTSARAQDISISVGIAPPPLVEDDQPVCPDDGYIWTPGYWAYDQDAGEYYWVAGSWEQPPEPGLLWTPAYWGWDGNDYVFYPGYWGPTVGFYGGVNYGYGYWGNGYGGGRWDGGHFSYNTAANNVSGGRVHNTYSDPSVVRSSSSRVSYNGGRGGVSAQPTAEERQNAQKSHVAATPQQKSHFEAAAQTRSHPVKVGAGKPAVASPGTQPENGSQLESHSSTAEQAQPENRDPMEDKKTPPIANESQTPVSNYPKTEQTAEKPAAELPPSHESETPPSRPEMKPSGPSANSAPPAKPEMKEDAHPQPAAHPQAAAQPQGAGHPPAAQPQGQDKPHP